MSATKDIKVLINAYEEFARTICDAGSFIKRHKKHITIIFSVQGNRIRQTFPTTPNSGTAVKKAYSGVRRSLRQHGIVAYDDRFSVHLITSADLGNKKSHNAVLKQLNKVLENEVRYSKPYKRTITYRRYNKQVSYIRYYGWKTRYSANNQEEDYLCQLSRGEYDEQVAITRMRSK